MKGRALEEKIEQQVTTLQSEELISRYLALLNRIESVNIRYGLMGKLADLYLVVAQEYSAIDNYVKGDEYLKSATIWYLRILESHPNAEQNDLVLYQLAKAYDLLGMENESAEILEQLVNQFDTSDYVLEAAFRLGEIYYSRGDYGKSAFFYQRVIDKSGPKQAGYYTNALNMMGWVHFKEGRYQQAFTVFMSLLLIVDEDYSGAAQVAADDESVKTGFQLREDVIRVICITLTYLKGHETLSKEISQYGGLSFISELYDSLATFYLSKFQYHDAAETWEAYISKYPQNSQSFGFSLKIQQAYTDAALPTEVRKAKAKFVKRFGIKSGYWPSQNDPMSEFEVKALLKTYRELAIYHHSIAKNASGNQSWLKDSKTEHLKKASDYYRQFLTLYPETEGASEITYLLAITKKELLEFELASYWFEKVAYDLPDSQWAESAAIEAIDCYNQQLVNLDQANETADVVVMKAIWNSKTIALTAYLKRFPAGDNRQAVLSDLLQTNFRLADYEEVIRIASEVIDDDRNDGLQRVEAASLMAKAQFASEAYSDAKQSFESALQLLPVKKLSESKNYELKKQLTESLSASLYQHGLSIRASSPTQAISLLEQLSERLPSSKYYVPAQLELANILTGLKRWEEAGKILVQLRNEAPQHELLINVSDKLIFLYEQSQQWESLAAELDTQLKAAANRSVEKEKTAQIAYYYDLAGMYKEAVERYKILLNRYVSSLSEKLSVLQKIADIYDKQGDIQGRNKWLKQVVQLTNRSDKKTREMLKQNEHIAYMGAQSALAIAEYHNQQFQQVRLINPLDRNIELKMKRLNETVEAYSETTQYGFPLITNQSTYQTATIFSDFATSLLKSERPKDLTTLQREEYDLLLEEQAFPLEEKAIALHELNMRRIAEAPLDPWVNRSFSSLKLLLPVRYNKDELIPEWVNIE